MVAPGIVGRLLPVNATITVVTLKFIDNLVAHTESEYKRNSLYTRCMVAVIGLLQT